MANPQGRPPYTYQRRGRWFWEPPPRLRGSRFKVQALGADPAIAWEAARNLNRQLAGDEGSTPGSVRWLFDQFEQADVFRTKAASTQKDYRWLGRLLAAHVAGGIPLGSLPARSLRPRHADAIYAALRERHGHATAHYACRYARRVWKWARRQEQVGENPWSGMELQSVGKRSQRWSPDQVAAFCDKARALGWPSQGLAVQLSYWLTHRQGDVLGITHAELEQEGIETRKTGASVPVVVSAYPELVAGLAQAERDQEAATEQRRQVFERAEAKRARRETREPAPFGEVVPLQVVVCETTGLAWKPDHFRHVFREIAAAAGLPADIQFRDLRATGLTELADAGATDAQRRTHGGHTTAAMALRYARPTPEQFEEAARRRLEHREQKAAGRRNARRNVGTGGGGTA